MKLTESGRRLFYEPKLRLYYEPHQVVGKLELILTNRVFPHVSLILCKRTLVQFRPDRNEAFVIGNRAIVLVHKSETPCLLSHHGGSLGILAKKKMSRLKTNDNKNNDGKGTLP